MEYEFSSPVSYFKATADQLTLFTLIFTHICISLLPTESISINHKDSRWVGAWWLGFLVSGFLMLLAGIPFWFLPNTLAKQCKSPSKKKQKEDIQAKNSSDTPEEEQEQGSFLPEDNTEEDAPQPVTMAAMAKGIVGLIPFRFLVSSPSFRKGGVGVGKSNGSTLPKVVFLLTNLHQSHTFKSMITELLGAGERG